MSSLQPQKIKEEIVVLCNLINMSGQIRQCQIETGTTLDVSACIAGNDTSYSCNRGCRHLHLKANLKLSRTSCLRQYKLRLWHSLLEVRFSYSGPSVVEHMGLFIFRAINEEYFFKN